MWVVEYICLALSGIKTNKARAMLTMLGIIIGITSVISISSIGNTISGSVGDSMSFLGTQNITVNLDQKSNELSVASTDIPDRDKLTASELNSTLRKFRNGIDSLAVEHVVGDADCKTNKKPFSFVVKGVDEGYFSVNDVQVQYGRKIQQKDVDAQKRVIIISDMLSNKLFGRESDPCGKELRFQISGHEYSYTVIGTYVYKESLLGSNYDGEEVVTDGYIPISSAQKITGATLGLYSGFTIRAASGVAVEDLSDKVSAYLNEIHKSSIYEVSCFSTKALVSEFSSILSTLTTGLSVIGAISLVVGGIGVMNIMLVSVSERTKEIGIRKAMGATRASIRLQFLIESVIICLIGGILGICLGLAAAAVIAILMNVKFASPLKAIVVATTFSVSIGLFFGIYPADLAARKKPIDALKFE